MTPDTVAQAIYEISQAAENEREAVLGGAELGRMLIAQFRAQGKARRQLGSASGSEIESTLEQLATSRVSHQAKVADSALDAWRHAKIKE